MMMIIKGRKWSPSEVLQIVDERERERERENVVKASDQARPAWRRNKEEEEETEKRRNGTERWSVMKTNPRAAGGKEKKRKKKCQITRVKKKKWKDA